MRVLSEGPIKLTKANVDAAWRRRSQSVRLVLRDAGCRGLALIVNATSMTWTYAYRPRGTDPVTGRRWPNRTVTLGNPATHSPDDARIEANKVKGQAAAGADPAAEKRAKAEATRRKRGSTLARLLDLYEKALPLRPKLRGTGLPSAAHIASEIAQARAAVDRMDAASMAAADLTTAELRAFLDATGDRPATARAQFGAVSRFLDWCQDAGHIPSNPCLLVSRARRPRAPQARSHFLTLAELADLWCAAESMELAVHRDLARFLIAVPCRRGEAAHLDWAHVRLSDAEWRQPSHLTKNRDPHRLHLHDLAAEILNTRHKAAGQPKVGLVFPAPRSSKPIDTFSDMKAELVEETKLAGWTWHDFRRSFATVLGEAGVAEPVVDAVLNHRQSATRGGVLGVYQRAQRWPEQMKAMQTWAAALKAAIERKPIEPNVVTLHRTA